MRCFDDTDKENPVIPRSNAIGTWEKFYVEKQSDGTYAIKNIFKIIIMFRQI